MRGRDEGITWLWCKVLFMSPFSKPGRVPASAGCGTWAITTSRCCGPGLGGLLNQLSPPCLGSAASSSLLEDRRILPLVLGLGAEELSWEALSES